MKLKKKMGGKKPRTSAMTPGPCYFDGLRDEQVGECDGVPGSKDYCFGCKQWICYGHSKNDEVLGGHDPYVHLEGGGL